MAEVNCNACEEIRQTSPEFIVNGLTDDICTSLQNDTGLNPADDHNDCDDLHNLNDCLVGNYATEVEAYDVCDWKEFMRNFIPNVWTTFKGIICSICGMWTMLHKHECEISTIMSGQEFEFGEGSSGESYIVAGQGVTFLEDDSTQFTSDTRLLYIAGGLLQFQGTFRFRHSANFQDPVKCYNFDDDGDGSNYSKNRIKNSVWGTTGAFVAAGEIICQLRLKKSEYPQIQSIFSGIGAPTGGGEYQVNLTVTDEGGEYWGQHGHDSSKYVVPAGWTYVTVRMINNESILSENTHYSPRGFMGIRFNRNELVC